jgi:hypothetical protein
LGCGHVFHSVIRHSLEGLTAHRVQGCFSLVRLSGDAVDYISDILGLGGQFRLHRRQLLTGQRPTATISSRPPNDERSRACPNITIARARCTENLQPAVSDAQPPSCYRRRAPRGIIRSREPDSTAITVAQAPSYITRLSLICRVLEDMGNCGKNRRRQGCRTLSCT